LKIPGEGKKILSGTELIKQESIFYENKYEFYRQEENQILLNYWKEE